MRAGLADLIDGKNGKRIIICVGSGGVGKTTTAAALAVEAARMGRRTLVLTIDPARRLATSLGIATLDHEERRIPDERLAAAGPVTPGGSLHAMMLDQKRAFDELVERYARDAQVRERIFANRIYQQISSALSGSHEYAAMAKLYQLERDRDYDVVVVDTPPTAHALDFLDAPAKLIDAIDSPAIEWFVKPLRSSGRLSMRLLGIGGSYVLKRLSKFVGSAFLEEMARFFIEFNDVLGGFRERAREVFALLRQPKVAFVLVTAPEASTLEEAGVFKARLRAAGLSITATVVNRVNPPPPPACDSAELAARLAARPECAAFAPYDLARAADALVATRVELATLAEANREAIAKLTAGDAARRIICVPLLDEDVHDLAGLGRIARHLV